MKKLVLLTALLLGVSALCFASARGNFEIFGGRPSNWDRGEVLGLDATTRMTSFSIGFSGTNPVNDFISLGVYTEIIFPQRFDISVGGETITTERSYYDSLVGMSLLFGPVFYLYSGERLSIPLVAGLRWMWLMASAGPMSLFGSQLGLGAGIGAELHVSERVYFFGRLMGFYDFFTTTTITVSGPFGTSSAGESGFTTSLGLTPHIGIGFAF